MIEASVAQPLHEQGVAAESRDASFCRVLNWSVLTAARLAGRTARVSRDGLSAAGIFLAKPLRARKSHLAVRVGAAIRRAEARIRGYEKERDELAELLAKTPRGEETSPMSETNAREIADALETTKAKITRIRCFTETLEKTAGYLEQQLGLDDAEEKSGAAEAGSAKSSALPAGEQAGQLETPEKSGSESPHDRKRAPAGNPSADSTPTNDASARD